MFRADEALRTAREAAGLSARHLAEHSGRPVSTISRIETGRVAPSVELLDDLLRICGFRLAVLDIEASDALEARRQDTHVVTPPIRRNDRGDNPWDDDAVQWLLGHPEVTARFERGPLFECLRKQANRLASQPHRVKEAEDLARKHGVVQREVYDPGIGKTVVRLIRTDPDAPEYPW
jgi:transcriptional regulator with XRE-family HTH domain